MPHFVRSPYNYDMAVASDDSGLLTDPNSDEGRSLTVQSQADEADINVLMKRFGVTGQVPMGSIRTPTYQQFEDVFDFQTAMQAVVDAREGFMSLNADVRARFHNDPQEFLEFCTIQEDGKLKNIEEMRKLGLAVPEPVVVDSPPMKVEVVNPNPPEVK